MFRIDLTIPGVSTVGGFSMCSAPSKLIHKGELDLAIKYSSHPPAHWAHTQVKDFLSNSAKNDGRICLNSCFW